MALSEQTAARLVGFDELGVQVQISTLQVIEATFGGRCRPTCPRRCEGSAARVGAREQGRSDA